MVYSRLCAYKFLRLSLLIMFFTLWAGGNVFAQESVDVRASNNADYSRLVFDWKSGAEYSAEKQDSNIIISFKKAGQANVGDVANIKNIGSVAQISSTGEPLKFSVAIPSSSKYRHFKIGNRIIVDVYNSADTPSRSAVKTPEPVQEEAKPEIKQEPKEITPAPSSDELKQAEPESKQEDTLEEEEKPAEIMRDANLITVSSTRNLGIAVFERAGFLWVVQDDPELKIPPTISGPNKDKMGQFEEIKMTGGRAFRLAKPEGVYFYGEGGGLLWRIVISPNPRNKRPMKMETKETDVAGKITQSIIWPFDDARKVLTVTDPLVGDDIKVVTVGDAAKTIGPSRQMVDMEVLSSIIGLAVVPNIDKLDINTSKDGVTLSSAQGLAVSPSKDTASLILKDDIEKENQYFKRAENKRDMGKIYDFNTWEMGGLRPLDENRRILMVGAANKQGSARVEDLITMAKLNLANDRGPEALGLLRVAEKELPGIEDTPEYIALRGAAGVLGAKFDEAITDLMQPKIQQFDEINYWKAAALAGLEDWQQADKVMPTNYDVLESYPAPIKKPLALALTEVALRAGNINVAERLLSMLEPSFEKMAIHEKSAWRYLHGEMERQSGNPEEALKNWEDLLMGKDDYYRAKAGLSVTRMQLERQKITPAKAIDRLEGLRYAWRGDELETVINYRLGQVYIDNKEYLKGLSILRNAIGLSPNSKISGEVTDYMTKTFRDLFTDGTLDDVSPLDAVTIYDEFKELTPVGQEGDIFVQNLAERLVKADLLGRAAALLEDQMNFRVQGVDKAKVGVRLAAIYLLDSNPDAAIKALDVAEEAAGGSLNSEIKMLRARALSKKGEANKALGLLQGLPNNENMAKLKADIAWNGGLWNDAANAFGDLIAYEGISPTRPMSEYQENLLLNRSIALNLSGNRTGLASIREAYGDLMKQSEKARIFDVVTRPRQLGVLEDRESVTSLISEVDLFGGFLENYKASQ